MKNRLNDLDSKSYMKFLKSWTLYDDNTLADFARFFSKQRDEEEQINTIAIWGFSASDKNRLAGTGRYIVELSPACNNRFSYAMINLSQPVFGNTRQLQSFFDKELKPLLARLQLMLKDKAYLTLFCSNFRDGTHFFPSAWLIGKLVRAYFEMKDEKLLCCDPVPLYDAYFPLSGDKVIYALNFRKTDNYNKSDRSVFNVSHSYSCSEIKPWFVLKPPPRKEKVKLHPAKFPEILVEKYIKQYSNAGDNIFDPMSGTGSTQLAALSMQRNAYGCELADHFHEIALHRITHIDHNNDYYLALDDAWNFDKHERFPAYFDYIITSPPYWDMLNMDGAHTQKARNRNGLRTNYSELDTDIGNCANYDIFLTRLLKIYNKILLRLKPGGYFTVIIKNIKKKGVIYTFAWDIVENLTKKVDISQIHFWLQDDIRIAPYGYGNAWVSNTFHQYCLTFKKP